MGEYGEYVGRGLRKANSIVNKIIVTRQYPGNDAQAFLIVEGFTDEKFYRSFIDEDKCQIIVADGKATAVEVVSLLGQEQFIGILALVDADFDVLEGLPSPKNVLFTDTHDLETMIIKSPALAKVLREFGSQNKVATFEQHAKKNITTVMLENGLRIGYLRWASLRNGLSLTFEELEFEKFVSKEKLILDIAKLIKTVKDKSQKPGLLESDVLSKMKQLENAAHDPWHVCCGHDLVCILSLGLTKAIGTHSTKEVTPEIVEKLLRLAYERSYFVKTQVYLLIRQWEHDNTPFTILSQE